MKNVSQISGVLVLAAMTVVMAMQSGYPLDGEVARLLRAPTVIEQWLEHDPEGLQNRLIPEELPLNRESRLFAAFLDPNQHRSNPGSGVNAVATAKRPKLHFFKASAKTSPPFSLLATSCCPAHPSKSLALIDEFGRGRRWVRPGMRLGRMTVDRIDNGLIVYRDGDIARTLATRKGKKRPLIAAPDQVPPLMGSTDTDRMTAQRVTGQGQKRPVSQPDVNKPVLHRLGAIKD